MTSEQVSALAAYNQWMNERLYEIAASQTDEERRTERGAFFGSIHGTFNHILLGDRLWLGRFAGRPYKVDSLDQELYSDFETLHAQRRMTDQDILSWAHQLTDEALQSRFEFTSIVSPRPRACPLWVAVTHFFNHQTHHRGQITTMLSQCGLDYGVTDFMWLPGLVEDLEV